MAHGGRQKQGWFAGISCLVATGVAVVAASACGGRIDSGFDRAPGPSATVVTGRKPPSSGPGSGRPEPLPTTPASAASEIAETYCKTFSSCCVGAKQPPIDVARCREITSAAVMDRLVQTSAMTAGDLLQCVDAIKTRTSACGKEDYPWSRLGNLALFGPPSIQEACVGLIGKSPSPVVTGPSCAGGKGCSGGETCAVDICVEGAEVGEPCSSGPSPSDGVCLDGASCVSGLCTRGELAVDAACNDTLECRLGLVCAKGACAPARKYPELYAERHSPYRVGADTCKAFTDL